MGQETDTLDTNAADDFDTAFDDALAEPAATPPAKTPEAPAPATTEESTTDADTTSQESGEEGADKGKTPAAAEPAPAAEPAKTEPAPAPAATPAATEPAKPEQPPALPAGLDPKFLAQAIAEATAAQQAPKNTQQEPAAPVEAKPEDFHTAEETAAIAEFVKEWPSEHRAVQAMMKGAIQSEVTNRVAKLVGELNVALTPLFQQTEQVQQTSFQTFVHAKHPDAVQVLPEVEAWIKTQPAIYRPALQEIYDKGTAQQVVELLDMFKQAKVPTGAVTPPPASPAAQEPVPPKPRQAPAPAAVRALAAVPAGQRTQPVAGADVNDFDAAFDEALGA